MKIEFHKLSRVGNNVLVDLYLDGVKVNPSGPLQMSPSEFEEFVNIIKYEEVKEPVTVSVVTEA